MRKAFWVVIEGPVHFPLGGRHQRDGLGRDESFQGCLLSGYLMEKDLILARPNLGEEEMGLDGEARRHLGGGSSSPDPVRCCPPSGRRPGDAVRCIQDLREMREACRAVRREDKTLGFVPTMGALHAGHASLIERARRECDAVAISIFVNPTQFGPGEDYEGYPRTWEEDLRVARSLGVDLVFHPRAAEMYPEGFTTYVEVERLAAGLCGRHRPGHFRGVATVVLKLFAVVRPHRAYFGEKDYQQLVLIRRMVEDLNLDVEVVGCPIVREADGLALSSRNSYLNAEERRRALSLHRGLGRAQSLLAAGERGAAALEAVAREELEREGLREDYVSVVHPDTLEPMERVDAPARMAVAAWVGRARLIDNCPLEPPRG